MTKSPYNPDKRVEPIAINRALADGEMVPLVGGIEVYHTPGHCAGHISLFCRKRSMLFVGDACMNIMGLGDPVGFEDLEKGRASQRKLAALSFDSAGFGHGPPILRHASNSFREKWSNIPDPSV